MGRFIDVPPPSPQPNPVEKTETFLRKNASDGFAAMVKAHNAGMAEVWSNRFGLTPQQVFDQLGADAVKLKKLAELNLTMIYGAAQIEGIDLATLPRPPIVPPAGASLTENDDGTVTVIMGN